jgi:hypothetical protein
MHIAIMPPQIPKRLVQTNEYGVPPHVETLARERAPGWDYRFYTHEDIVAYFADLQEDDPDCKPLHDAICEAHGIDNNNNNLKETGTTGTGTGTGTGIIKLADLLQLHEVFMYYHLYKTGGACMDTGVIVHDGQTLDTIVEQATQPTQEDDHFLIAIESCLTPVIFTGFMACSPRHPVLRKAIQHICSYVDDWRRCCRDGAKFDVTQIKTSSVMHAAATSDPGGGVTLLKELIPPNACCANIYNKDPDKVALCHYFTDKIVPLSQPLSQPPKGALKDIKIGISAAVPSHMFNNGIHQNTLYFYDVMKNIGYTPYLVVTNTDYARFKKSPPDGWNSAHYDNVVSFSQMHRIGFHAVVTFGVQISHIALQQLRHAGVKLVSYVCGNEYLINSEAILYSHSESGSFEQDKTNPRTSLFDEVWLIPQMMELNAAYKRTLSRCSKVIEAPFIWSPDGMETIAQKGGATLNDFLYINAKTQTHDNTSKAMAKSMAKSMAIFDPNISIMKWFLPSFVLCERAYQLAPQLVDRVYITNAFREKIGDTMNSKKIENTVRYTDLFLDKRVFFEKRFITFEFMKTHADVAVFHQWGNPLNYIYLEMAWLGYPFVHNAHLCADLGYYYEGYNLEQGAEVLLGAIMKHDAVAREYLRVNRERVDRYLPTNAALQQKYKKMFDDLFFAP